MNKSTTFIRYSLRNRLFVLAGATFFLCAVVILLFFPLLNITLEGLDIIEGQKDAQGRYLTYLFYRREAPELKPMAGPQKIMKSFQGLEQDLINSITTQQRVDNTIQESVNRGPKEEGEMLLRYMPVHVLLADEGAVFWGVAKIGIDTNRMRQLLFIQSQEQSRIRRDIWVEIILSLFISGVLAMSLIYFWVRPITETLW